MMAQITSETSIEDLKETLRRYIFVSIISSDNNSLEEEIKQEIMRRYNEHKNTGNSYDNWNFILEPIEDLELRDKYLKLLD